MADDVDLLFDRDAILEAVRLKGIRDQVKAMPVGKPGTCEVCGGWSGRLVRNICAPCRDFLKL